MNTSVQVEIETMSDPITIVCPPAVDLFEGQMEVPIGTNISIRLSAYLAIASCISRVEVSCFVENPR